MLQHYGLCQREKNVGPLIKRMLHSPANDQEPQKVPYSPVFIF